MYKGPINADAVLTAIYGPDYMTPPPVEDRDKHGIEIIAKE